MDATMKNNTATAGGTAPDGTVVSVQDSHIQSVPETLTVDPTNDAVYASPGDGICDDGSGKCTLRAAIIETNALVGPNTITLPVSNDF